MKTKDIFEKNVNYYESKGIPLYEAAHFAGAKTEQELNIDRKTLLDRLHKDLNI